LLHVQIAEEHAEFRLGDVIYGIANKLVRRHPHVFADAVAETPEEVMDQWDELKRVERGTQSALTGIPLGLPALAYAQAIQRRASKAGFAFESADQAWEALEEEIEEFRSATTPETRRGELGDVIFALANVARWHDVDAEDALRDTCHNFAQSFRQMEDIVRERGIHLPNVATAEKLALWEEAKAKAP
jgi:tetrapyrrole methylase family protein/MazG family protein